MRFKCSFCGGFSFSGMHPRCESAVRAMDVDNDQSYVVLFPGEEHAVTVTRSELEQYQLRQQDEDQL